MANQQKKKTPAVGFRYLLIVGAITSVLLLVNIVCVNLLMSMNSDLLYAIYPDEVVQFRFAQAMQIFLPVIMTMAQFWVFDRFVDRAFGYGTKSNNAESKSAEV